MLIYLKGADKYNSFVAYIMSDLITLLAFFLRFFLQIIRWCLFLTTYYLLHEFVFEWMYNFITNMFIPLNYQQYLFMLINNNVFLNLIITFIRFTFEILDTCLILVIQITAFAAVILWLFNFLFSLSIEDIYENQYTNK